jgi:hypothetical protein
MAGAYAILTRTPVAGLPVTYSPICLSVAPFTISNYAPFQGGEELMIETLLKKCDQKVGNPVKLIVSSSLPNAPIILDDICTDAKEILLSGLEINAVVEFTFEDAGNIVTLVFGASAPQDRFSLSLGQPGAPKLVPGMKISVRQNLCGSPTSWSRFNSTSVFAAEPKVPTPTAPINASTVPSLTPKLIWRDEGQNLCSRATKFDIRVATNPVMAPRDIVFNPVSGVGNTSVVVPLLILKPGNTYYWQVRAYHDATDAPSTWSMLFKFTTQQAPTPPAGEPTPPAGNREFVFCITYANGTENTITIMAPDWATADSIAATRQPSDGFYRSGKCGN